MFLPRHRSLLKAHLTRPISAKLLLLRHSDLEQEHVVGPVAAVDGELPGALLGRNHMQLRRKGRDRDESLPGNVGPGHRELQALGSDLERQRRGDRSTG